MAKQMPQDELLAEVEWQLSFGMHPLYISEQMQKSVSAINKAAWRAGNQRVALSFNPYECEQRSKRKRKSS